MKNNQYTRKVQEVFVNYVIAARACHYTRTLRYLEGAYYPESPWYRASPASPQAEPTTPATNNEAISSLESTGSLLPTLIS